MSYLRKNRDLAYEKLQAAPGLTPYGVEATYLIWLDANELGVENPCKFFESHGVGLSDGQSFGTPGYLRLNFGCTRELLSEGLTRITEAVSGL